MRTIVTTVYTPAVGIPRRGGFYGNSPSPLVLDNVVCFGNESSILECQHNGLGIASCSYRDDAGVQCLGRKTDYYFSFTKCSFSFISSLFTRSV